MNRPPKDLNTASFELEYSLAEFAKKAADMFLDNNWTWSSYRTQGSRVPTAQDIEGTLSNLIWKAICELKKSGKEHACVGTGRLQVRFNKYPSGWIGSMEVCPLSARS